jgi:hypothetical protein
MAAWSSGNGGSTASTDTVVLGFGFTGSTAREREGIRGRRERRSTSTLSLSREWLGGVARVEDRPRRSLQPPGRKTTAAFYR